jgi:hypothetical protein
MQFPKDLHKSVFSLGFAIISAVELYKYIQHLLK